MVRAYLNTQKYGLFCSLAMSFLCKALEAFTVSDRHYFSSFRVYLKKKKNSPKSGLEILQQRYTFYHKESKILKLKELLNDKEGKEDTVLVTSKEV